MKAFFGATGLAVFGGVGFYRRNTPVGSVTCCIWLARARFLDREVDLSPVSGAKIQSLSGTCVA